MKYELLIKHLEKGDKIRANFSHLILKDLLKEIGNPHENFSKIQVIGTNGKGSTSLSLSIFLEHLGFKVGLYTSPHVYSYNERIAINREFISNKDFEEFANIAFEVSKKTQLSVFEILTLMAILYFSKKKVDFVILEAGLGGRFDATTACDSEVIVYSPIDIDHINILGDTIEKIAIEKFAAISGETKKVFITSNQKKEIFPIFNNFIKNKSIFSKIINIDFKILNYGLESTKIIYKEKEIELEINNKGSVHNFLYAYEIIKNINTNLLFENLENLSKDFFWPSRFEFISKNPNIFISGDHNEQGINLLAEHLLNLSFKKVLILCGFSGERPIIEFIKIFKEKLNNVKIILSNSPYNPAINDKNIADVKENLPDVEIILDYEKALNKALKDLNHDLVITGSIYFVSAIRKKWKTLESFKKIEPDVNLKICF